MSLDIMYLNNFAYRSSDYNLFISQEGTSSSIRAKPSSCAVN